MIWIRETVLYKQICGGVQISGIYDLDAQLFDIYDVIRKYSEKTLIIHGTSPLPIQKGQPKPFLRLVMDFMAGVSVTPKDYHSGLKEGLRLGMMRRTSPYSILFTN